MIVTDKGENNFNLWLTKGEFDLIRRMADEREMDITIIISMLVIEGIEHLITDLE